MDWPVIASYTRSLCLSTAKDRKAKRSLLGENEDIEKREDEFSTAGCVIAETEIGKFLAGRDLDFFDFERRDIIEYGVPRIQCRKLDKGGTLTAGGELVPAHGGSSIPKTKI